MAEINVAVQQYDIVERIRSEDYLLDIGGESERVRRGAQSLQIKLNHALRLLSEDLYSTDSHFVLELVQNADDNEYPPGVVPELIFRFEPKKLVLTNNEVGFNEQNVKALCSVGESSKAKKAGYIGEKGIGFKSVFAVSDAPEIHSNGFHFKFDRTNQEDLLGYVVPHWCDPSADIDQKSTCIVLPAADEVEFNFEMLDGLESRLLLFLTKLRKITLQGDGQVTSFHRQDEGTLSSLYTSRASPGDHLQEEENHFVRFSADIEMGEIVDPKRPGISASKVILAFPVTSEAEASPDTSSQVFAFLPIRQVGFKFAIQADFLLSSSREDIHVDRLWNRHLRDAIAVAFRMAVDTFKENQALAFSYLAFIPSPDEISDPFFKPVVSGIVDQLSQCECIPAAGGQWRRPDELRMASQAFMDLFPPAVSMELFGFDYVDQRVQGSKALLRKLGARDITHGDQLDVFAKHGDWFKRQPLEWRARFYAMLADGDLDELADEMADLPSIPTAGGDLLVPSESNVFYPLNRHKNYGFEHELTILDGKLFDLALSHSEKIPALFARLKVRKDAPYNLIASHILIRHDGDAWKTSEHLALIAHLRYVKDKFDEYLIRAIETGKTEAEAIQILREGMWIGSKKTEDGVWTFTRVDEAYISKEYRPKFCVETLAGDAVDASDLISERYLAEESTDPDANAESWRVFFDRIGACASPRVVPASGFQGNYECSQELLFLANSPKPDVRKALLECLDANWEKYQNRQSYIVLINKVQTRKATKFLETLRSMQAPLQRRRGTVPLSESFYRTEELVDVFGETLPFVDAILFDNRMLNACRISDRPNARACLKRLSQLKASGDDTNKQLQAIYRALERHWDADAAHSKQELESLGLIRIKGRNAMWCAPSQAAWRSNGTFLDRLYPPLEVQYKDFSGFFLGKLGIPRELPTEKWVDALDELGQLEDIADRRKEALAIYKRANRDLAPKHRRSGTAAPNWLKRFGTDEIFLDHRGDLVNNHDTLYANDDPEIANLFLDDEGLSFLAVPAEEVPRLSYLLDAADVERISASVTLTVVHMGESRIDFPLTARLIQSVPYLARILYASDHEAFDFAVDEKLFPKLQKLKVLKVPDLTLKVILGESYRETAAEIAQQAGAIFIKDGTRAVEDLLAGELCKFLGAPDMLADAFARVLMTADPADIEVFLRMRRFGPLPQDLQDAISTDAELQLPDSNQENETAAFDDETSGDQDSDTEQTGSSFGEDKPSPNSTPGEASGSYASSTHTASPPSAPASSPSPGSKPAPSAIDSSSGAHQNGGHEGSPAPTTNPAPPRHSPDSSPPAGNAGKNKDGANGNSNTWSTTGTTRGVRRTRSGKRVMRRTKSGRLLSYAASPAEPVDTNVEKDSAGAEARQATCDAAVAYFVANEAGRWKSITVMPHNNPGFDVHAVAFDGFEEFIEIKGQADAWTEAGVALTPTELITAHQKRSRYWLYVVEHAHEDKRRTSYLLKDPFGSTQQFRFDSGWKSSAIARAASPTSPEAGMKIEIPNVGHGRVLSVRKKGRFYNVHVILHDGGQVNKAFNPATMKLSLE